MMLNASGNEWKKTSLMLSLASTEYKSLASKVSYSTAKGQNFQITAKNKRVRVQSEFSHRADTTNVNRIANSLMEKLGQCNEMFTKLQETTNKHVENTLAYFLSTVILN